MKHDRRELFGLGALAGIIGLSAAKAQPAEVDPGHVWVVPERQPWTRICTRCQRSISDHARKEFEWHQRPGDPPGWWEQPCPGEPA